ncbi:redox-regulated ATPase YchF [Chloroflexota bacterium]
MSLNIGIIGLPDSGRTTIFNALTGSEVATGGYTGEGSVAPHIGTAQVPDQRLTVLADIFYPDKVTPASVTFIDIGASLKDVVEGKGLSGRLLHQISNLDVLINVVRAFSDDSIPHIEGSLDTERDIANMNLELTFSDLALLERRLLRIEATLKAAKPAERSSLLREQGLIERVKADLEKDMPVRDMTLTEEETRALSGYQLLSAKPLLIVINIGERQLSQDESLAVELSSRYTRPKCQVTTACAGLEMEFSQLDDIAAEELRSEYGMEEPGSNLVIRLSYHLLGLISFFTVGSDEVKAWSIQSGTDAIKAAGKIHSDIERGFIRAEVITYEDMVKCGTLTEARKKGLLRLEGKSYTVQDGDIINFLFNV